ncbi:MAG: hypothetical protein CFE44_16460 [Burkholderiales bacterium PBB4]|nr:MAG: hypothetical protein CFE44_16460 [Burkholderiales bacterium PBB4]
MTVVELVYVVAGIALPAYYLPQILVCARDQTRLASYSMSKAATQWALRAAMLPFVFGVGNATMTWVVSLDFMGRTAEFGVALSSLLGQGLAPTAVVRRCFPIPWRRVHAGQDPATMVSGEGLAALEDPAALAADQSNAVQQGGTIS